MSNIGKLPTAVFFIIALLISFACGGAETNWQTVKVDDNEKFTKSAETVNSKTDSGEPKGGETDGDAKPVPAKRENLTYEDRDKLAKAMGYLPEGESSKDFVKALESNTINVGNAGVKFYNIGENKFIVEIMTDPGNYLQTYQYGIYTEKNSKEATVYPIKLAELDDVGNMPKLYKVSSTTGRPVFDDKTKNLEIFAFARGIGDCGKYYKYNFDKSAPKLIELRTRDCQDGTGTVDVKKWKKLDIDKIGYEKSETDNYSNDVAILNKWLAKKPELQITSESAYGADNLANLRSGENNPQANPYYVSGDFNNDGKRDFAFLLSYKDKRKGKTTDREYRSLVVFEDSASASANPKPVYNLEKVDGFYILIYKDKTLYVAAYESDDGGLLVPKGKSYEYKDMMEDF